MDKPSFYWGIASYDRADRQPMLLSLAEMGYKREEIILSVQTPTDYDNYRERYAECATIIFRPGRNVSENKNNILDWLEQEGGNTRVVMCSDKVRAINVMGRNKKLRPIATREEMDAFVRKAFYVAKHSGATIWGVAPVANTFYMDRTISTNLFMLGCFMGILNPAQTKFDPGQTLKEDWEIMLRTIAAGGQTMRFNDVCLTATFHTQGGAHVAWNTEGDQQNEYDTTRLLAMYPDLIKPHATRKNELRYVGATTKLKQSIFDL